MKLTEIIREEENEFNKFGISVFENMSKTFICIKFTDVNVPAENSRVGSISMRTYREFCEIDDINISENYRNKGYSKFMYRIALNYARNTGKTGLLVGHTLLNQEKSYATYDNFIQAEYIDTKSKKNRILLTEWRAE